MLCDADGRPGTRERLRSRGRRVGHSLVPGTYKVGCVVGWLVAWLAVWLTLGGVGSRGGEIRRRFGFGHLKLPGSRPSITLKTVKGPLACYDLRSNIKILYFICILVELF